MGTRGSFWAAASAGLRGWAYTNAAQESNDLGFRVASPQGVGDATVGMPQPQSIAAPQAGLKFQAAFVTVLAIVTMF